MRYRWCWDREPDDVRLLRRGAVVVATELRPEDGALVTVLPTVNSGPPPLLRHVAWPVVVVEQVAVLVLGGGLLSVVVRHGRRRRAGAAA